MLEELLEEWCYEENGSPENYTKCSNYRATWKCKFCGHKWKTAIFHRVYGSGCPKCSKFRKRKETKNNLMNVYPDTAKYWDYELNDRSPDEMAPKSTYCAHWVCDKDSSHKWEAKVCDMTDRKAKCLFCHNKIFIKGRNDLESYCPEIVCEWSDSNEIKPNEVKYTSRINVEWKCKKGHIWSTSPYHRVVNKSGCPYCSGKRIIPYETDFLTKHPELESEWDFDLNEGIDPRKIGAGTCKKVFWRCPDGHSYETTVRHRCIEKSGCPYCAGQRVILGKNDFKTVHPELVKFWDYERNRDLLPEQVTGNSEKAIWLKCDKGHSYKIKAYKLKTIKEPCSKCRIR